MKRSVGIDLGTTHTAVAWTALDGDTGAPPRVFAVPQLVRPGEVEARPLLPSFLYLPHPDEIPAAALRLPWNGGAPGIVGELARSHGSLTPTRLVSSAKSWLCHPALDRRAASLPAGADDDVPRVSPVEASARYLAHVREAWNATMAREDPSLALESQDVTLTVPASFDAVARELTVEAALAAGLPRPTLLEEPQAALYAWVSAMGDRWRTLVRPGDLLLVCDVGGGTTDFSLIAVVDRGGELGLERIAVGDHILLGGDNMDLAVARAIAEQLSRKLDRWQMLALTHAARQAKEALFADPTRASYPISVAGRGSSLVGGALKAKLDRTELVALVVDGFFPKVPADARPAAQRRLGLTTLGLPYASDPAVTRHLAAFLTRNPPKTAPVPVPGRTFPHPTAVLFNGGVMKAAEIRARVLEVLGEWIQADGGQPPRELPSAELELAVAQGAAFYGGVRHGKGIRIRGGTARAHYVGIETAMPAVPGLPPPIRAVCIAPMGMEEGTGAELDLELGLVVGEPAQFRLFASPVRRDDRVGDEVEDWESLDELPPVEATLPAEGAVPGQVVPVRLRARVTEVGTLEIECLDRSGRAWRLEFNLRAGAGEAV